MTLCFREQRQLRYIEASLFRADSHLTGMLDVFGRLYSGQDMPASEQVAPGHDRDHRAVTWLAAASAAVALAIGVLFSVALAVATSVRRAQRRPSAAQPERTRSASETDGRQNPPG